MELYNYLNEKPWYYEYCGKENFHFVVDKLIRITAKVTERYASDILYALEHIMEKLEADVDFEVLFGFYEDGVHAWYDKKYFNEREYIQYWHLSYKADGSKFVFRRVRA